MKTNGQQEGGRGKGSPGNGAAGNGAAGKTPRPDDAEVARLIAASEKRLGRPVCGAWLSKRGKVCEANKVTGRTRCARHGGKSPRGGASPHFKHGRFSKVLRGSLLSSYTESQRNADRHELGDELSYVDARLAWLVDEAQSNGGPELWKELRALVGRFNAIAPTDTKRRSDVLTLIFNTIHRGHESLAVWDKADAVLEQRRKLAESEWKRIRDTKKLLLEEHANTILEAVVTIIREEVPDREVQLRVAHRLMHVGDLMRGPAPEA